MNKFYIDQTACHYNPTVHTTLEEFAAYCHRQGNISDENIQLLWELYTKKEDESN